MGAPHAGQPRSLLPALPTKSPALGPASLSPWRGRGGGSWEPRVPSPLQALAESLVCIGVAVQNQSKQGNLGCIL